MKKERLEELVESVRAIDCGCLAYLDWDYRDDIRSALLAVERETVMRLMGALDNAEREIRSLLTEE